MLMCKFRAHAMSAILPKSWWHYRCRLSGLHKLLSHDQSINNQNHSQFFMNVMITDSMSGSLSHATSSVVEIRVKKRKGLILLIRPTVRFEKYCGILL